MLDTYEQVQQYVDEYGSADQVLRPEDYWNAINVQNACNLSGVILSFSEAMEKIGEEARHKERGTSWKNKHPIAILFACVVANLTTGDLINTAYYAEAYRICHKKANN
jgi:hypothetical protein